jgi:hypothetical protein
MRMVQILKMTERCEAISERLCRIWGGILAQKKMNADGLASKVNTARQLVEYGYKSNKALETLVQLLNGQGIDVSSKTPYEIKKLAQEQMKLLDQKIKAAQ